MDFVKKIKTKNSTTNSGSSTANGGATITDYVTLTTEQDITAKKTFTEDIKTEKKVILGSEDETYIEVDSAGHIHFTKAIVCDEDVVAYGAVDSQVQTVQSLITEVITDMKNKGELSSGAGITSVALDYNSTLYKFRVHIVDGNNENFYSEYVDLPIESVVVSGSYDADNEKIVLTLQDNTTLDIPVGQLIAGLASETYVNNAITTEVSNRNSAISTALANKKYSWDEITGKPSTFSPSAHNHYNVKDIKNEDSLYLSYNKTVYASEVPYICAWADCGDSYDTTKTVSAISKTQLANWLSLSSTYLGIKENAVSASKLNTSRTLWGQSFDGSANVSGDIIGAAGGINLEFTNEINCYNGALYLNHRGTTNGYNNQHTSDIYALANGGKFGIGTTNPTEKLTVNGNIALGAGTNDRHVYLCTDGDVRLCATNSGGWVMGTTYYKHDTSTFIGYGAAAYGEGDALKYYFYGGQYNTPSAVILPDGKVGIGAKKPTEKLEVNGNGKFNGYIGFLGVDGATRVGFIGRASGVYDNIYVNTDSTSNYVVLQSAGGNVGIGTRIPSNRLDVYGVIQSRAYEAVGNNNASFIFNNTSTYYTGIGANTEADTIYFGVCGVTGAWVSGYFQKWKFGGQIKVQSTDYECVKLKRCIGNGGAFSAFYANNQDDESYYCGMNSSKNFVVGRAVISQRVDVALFKIDNAGNVVANGDVTAYSDARLKSDIKDLEYRGPLSPKTYIKDGKKSIGFIAQEVKEKYPELVQGEETDTEYLSLNYGAITAVLAAENKELNNKVDKLENEVAELKELVKQLIGGK